MDAGWGDDEAVASVAGGAARADLRRLSACNSLGLSRETLNSSNSRAGRLKPPRCTSLCPAAAGKGHAAVGCGASNATIAIGCAAYSAGVWSADGDVVHEFSPVFPHLTGRTRGIGDRPLLALGRDKVRKLAELRLGKAKPPPCRS